jgi:hypothetical protein
MMPQNQVCWQPPLDEVGLLAFDLCCGSRWAVWALVAVLSKALSQPPSSCLQLRGTPEDKEPLRVEVPSPLTLLQSDSHGGVSRGVQEVRVWGHTVSYSLQLDNNRAALCTCMHHNKSTCVSQQSL